MGSKYVLDINSNDDLSSVIKKCNYNFRSVAGQLKQSEANTYESVNNDIGDVVDDLVSQINNEANTREHDDDDLENAIQTVDGKFSDYTKTADLRGAVLPYTHDDILWVIENNTVGEVMKKTNVSGYTDLVVRCVGEDGNPCYTPLCLIPEDSYQNYTANGKTFKMQINTSDNNRLWWVVPAGKWELWMR